MLLRSLARLTRPIRSMSSYLLMKDGERASTTVSSSNLLLQFERGAYTTGRTYKHDSVFEFSFHVQRLVESYTAMQLKNGASPVSPFASADAMRALLLQRLSGALREYDSLYADHRLAELKVTVLIAWNDAAAEHTVYTHLCPLPGVPRPPIKVHARCADRKQYAQAKGASLIRLLFHCSLTES